MVAWSPLIVRLGDARTCVPPPQGLVGLLLGLLLGLVLLGLPQEEL